MRYTAVTQIPSIAIKQGIVPEGAQITIAIPTYKRAHLLRETLESCLAQQTDFPFAIIVVDNNPERECETEKLLQEYQAIPHLFYYKNTENIGMGGNWNKLFELAQTDFVVMLHDDDLLYDDYIEKTYKILKCYNYDVNALYFGVKIFSNSKDLPIKTTTEIKALALKTFDFQFGNICNLAGAVFKRDIVIKLNGFDSYYHPSLDYEMHIRLAERGKSIKIYGYDTLYRISENVSMNREAIFKICSIDKEIMEKVTEKFPKIYRDYFFKYYLKDYDRNYIKWNKETYQTTDNQINEYLYKKELEATIFDKVVSKIASHLRNSLLFLFRKKHLKIDI